MLHADSHNNIIDTTSHIPCALAIGPEGHLYLDLSVHAQEVLSQDLKERMESYFKPGYAFGLLHLGLENFEKSLPPTFSFWQEFVHFFITQLCKINNFTEQISSLNVPSLEEDKTKEFLMMSPFMKGGEYLTSEILRALWREVAECLVFELKELGIPLGRYLSTYNSRWNLVGRICFHLAENKENTEKPFAFLATYTSKIFDKSVQHLPLGRALQEFAQGNNKSGLLALLLPIQKAAQQSVFIQKLVESKEIFEPLAWSAQQSYDFLKDIPLFESSGIVVRVPNWWNAKKPPRPHVSVTVGSEKIKKLGFDALVDFKMQIALKDEEITEEELERLLLSTDNLVKIKGQWVEINREKLEQTLSHWKKVQNLVKHEGLTFAEGMRLLAGASLSSQEEEAADVEPWSSVKAGEWFKEILENLHSPTEQENTVQYLKNTLQAELRPYQMIGVQWLYALYKLKLGGCLADDMGLGKTIQILSLLLLIKRDISKPNLLVVPTSLLGNWKREIEQFTPTLNVRIAHSSASHGAESIVTQKKLDKIESFDLIITTYGFASRLKGLGDIEWNAIILDEAQMIKNHQAKQTRFVKSLKSAVRYALTGTPIENRLSDLWSLFDFTSPGLLGSLSSFGLYGKKVKDSDNKNNNFIKSIRTLVSPYILRRLKTDKRIIKDLPDKIETKAFCTLTREQVRLYQHSIKELTQQLEQTEGIQRRGIVLSYLIRFKQICNHPVQSLGFGEYEEKNSGKFIRLREICEEIADKQEKVLIFTQFREIIPALNTFLENIFDQKGLTLHGQTSIKKRAQYVEEFQEEQGHPFFILSLKAGGLGLNLTRANHVIHFDRWWNPAVENQATDRAFRIGQKKNVLVHKFICQGTIEEKIDDLIQSKQTLSQEILSNDNEIILTELSNEELMKVVALDIHRALGEQ